tara:strand:- start:695 stop:4609 length:3915 start_codon:yes stop_codon:yes gene_type:complete
MSIFKETFPYFVRKQLEQREKIISSGAGRDSSGNFKFNKNERSNEFYAYSLSKQCTLRMSSAVDVIDESIFSEDTGTGASVAKRWVLEGGIKNNGSNRGGFTDGKKSNIAYGDKDLRGNAADGYGIVPMPGITSATVRTKSAYGSLREGKVDFVCHNKRQLEVLELLYMRPGYTLMLEWGWNPYINNNGNQESWGFIDDFFDSQKTTLELEKEILKKKEDTGGNYDALIGYCKNFTYKLRADGGFDCTTEIIAKGEILESLKGKEELVYDNNGDSSSVYARPALELLLQDLTNYSDDVEKIGDNVDAKERGNAIQEDLITKLGLSGDIVEETSGDALGEDALKPWIIADGPKGYQQKDYLTFWDDDERVQDGIYWNARDARSTTTWIRWDALCHLINNYAMPKDDFENPLIELQTNRIADEHTEEPKIKPLTYIEHIPFLLASSLTTIHSFHDLPGRMDKERKIDWNIVDVSTNNQVCMLPHTLYSHVLRIPKAVESDKLFKPLAESLAKRVMDGKEIKNIDGTLNLREQRNHIGGIYLGVEWMLYTFKTMYYDEDGNASDDYSLLKFIKKIWEGINKSCGGNHEFDLHTDNRPGGKIVRIIDMLANEDPELDLENLHELKIQSLDSVVRNVTYNTTIPSSLSATIAIAAQSPDSVDSLDKVSFAAMNRGIRDRFSTNVTNNKEGFFGKIGETNQRTLWNNEFDKNLFAIYEALYIFDQDNWDEVLGETASEYGWWSTLGSAIIPSIAPIIAASKVTKTLNRNFGGVLRDLVYYQYTINDNMYLREEAAPSQQNEVCAKYRGSLRSLHSAINYFSKVYGSNSSDGSSYFRGQPYTGASRSTSAIIPIKFNAQLDGISGIVIGNVFDIPKSRLPMAYSGDDVHFIVMGEEQTITAGQDWVTSITGHLILLGARKEDSKRTSFLESWKNVDNKIDKDTLSDIKEYRPREEEYNFCNEFAKYITEDDKNNLCDPLLSMNITSKYQKGRVLKHGDKPKDHYAIDLRAAQGTNVHAVWDGKIVTSEIDDTGCGGIIKIEFNSPPPTANSDNRSQSQPRYAVYCHMSRRDVEVGDPVIKGQLIGLSGGTAGTTGRGNSSDPHLHFALKNSANIAIPPAPWLPDNNDSWWENFLQGDWWFPNVNIKPFDQSAVPGDGIDYSRQGCFKLGTPIEMFDGTKKNIENIKKGDIIKSYRNGKYTSGIVTKHLIHPINDVIPVTHLGDIIGSVDHPIFINNKWYEISKAPINKEITYMFIDNWYNLEVDGHVIDDSDHNYIINGYIMSGLGDHEVLNNTFQRQTIYNTTTNYVIHT